MIRGYHCNLRFKGFNKPVLWPEEYRSCMQAVKYLKQYVHLNINNIFTVLMLITKMIIVNSEKHMKHIFCDQILKISTTEASGTYGNHCAFYVKLKNYCFPQCINFTILT